MCPPVWPMASRPPEPLAAHQLADAPPTRIHAHTVTRGPPQPADASTRQVSALQHSFRISQRAGVSPQGITVSNKVRVTSRPAAASEERATTWDAKRAAAPRVAPRDPKGLVVRPSQAAVGRLRPHASPHGFPGPTRRHRLRKHDTGQARTRSAPLLVPNPSNPVRNPCS